MAWHSQIIRENRGSHKASGPWIVSPLLSVEYRLLSHVLQMGDVPAAAAVFDEDMFAFVRHLSSYRKQLLRILSLHSGSYNFKVQQKV